MPNPNPPSAEAMERAKGILRRQVGLFISKESVRDLEMGIALALDAVRAEGRVEEMNASIARGVPFQSVIDKAVAEEREACARAVCRGCSLASPTFIEDGVTWHALRRSNSFSNDQPCRATAIRLRTGKDRTNA